ncbi:MAG: hypothetical protein LBQ00_09440 [Syntrophobacterales bacterium]|nr:hypothetical protein [Syntrophobacterales bacterium]
MSRKYLINILLALAAIGTMAFYAVCETSCSYLKGDILGLDLKYVGIIYMAAFIVLSILKKDPLLSILVSAGAGVEVFLVAFQVRSKVYCPFCLAFGVILFLLFLLNMDIRRKWIVILCVVLGFLSFVFFFRGSATPNYKFTCNYGASLKVATR